MTQVIRELTSWLAIDLRDDIQLWPTTVVNNRYETGSLILDNTDAKMLILHAINTDICLPQPL